jgi:hypothetical protein
VIVGAAETRSCSPRFSAAAIGARIGEHLLLVARELRLQASSNATALAAITCISGPPCVPGNTSELSFFVDLVVGAREDQAAARTAQRLVRRGRDDVGMRHGFG